jgi:hypothetical protein
MTDSIPPEPLDDHGRPWWFGPDWQPADEQGRFVVRINREPLEPDDTDRTS